MSRFTLARAAIQPDMDQAQTVFDSVGDVAAVKQLVDDRVQENIYLEFKTKKDRRTPELDDSDSFQFSRALSGFANSDGGVVIWGVETDKEERACALKPIAQVEDFAARLKKSMLNAVQPMVDGIVIETIVDASDSTVGFARCLVPRSDKTPHRALRAGREYFRRSAEGFYRLEHFDLDDAFGRRPRPVLLVQIQLVPRPEGDPHEVVHFSFLNEGRGVARHAAFTCQFAASVQVAQASGRINDNTFLNSGVPIISHQENVGVIHAVPILSAVGNVVIKRPEKGSPLEMSIRWYCEGMRLRTWSGQLEPGSPLRTVGVNGRGHE